MTDQNLTEIVCIIDRSGSMGSIRDDAIGGFNTFLEDQKKHPGEARLTYAQFDDVYEVIHNGVDIQKVEPIDHETYQPRGSTALLDAIGKTITTVGERLSKTPEHEKPGKVVVVILTDGKENASQEYNRQQIFDLITQQREQWQWEFVFLAANQDAIESGHGLGIAHAANFSPDSFGARGAYANVSDAISSYRTTAHAGDLDVDDAMSKDSKSKSSSRGRVH